MEFLENISNPFDVFEAWYSKAHDIGLKEPTAVALATATPDGKPSARMVLLKGFDERGFCIYTNLGSRKARELEDNPNAALLFYWMPINRQVRVEGRVEAVTKEEADAYFASRHPDSRVGAWASKQSQILNSRKTLEERVLNMKKELGSNPGRPIFWSGFRLLPDSFEFWEEGEFRMHNRRVYEKDAADGWKSFMLYP